VLTRGLFIEINLKHMYYRLFDTQTGRYMATGYNTESEKHLADAYVEYKCEGLDDEDETILRNWSQEMVIKYIEVDDFIIERSEVPFDERWEENLEKQLQEGDN